MSLDDVIRSQRTLTAADVADLRSKGHNLDGDKTYVFKFLFNDTLNNAVDPRKFKLDAKDLDKYAKQSIGRPYIVRADGNPLHIRIAESGNKNDDIKSMIELQTKYSVGDIKSTVRTGSNNVYGIIEVYDEYVQDIPTFPQFTSPTFYLHEMGANGTDVTNAEFLNIQGVPSPGYSKTVAGIKGTCTGGIEQCSRELRVLGAAGSLKSTRSLGNLGINTSKPPTKGMEGEGAMNAEQQLSKVVDTVTTIATTVGEVQKQQMAMVGVLKEVGSKTGVDTSKLGGEAAPKGDPPANTPPAAGGAAAGAMPGVAGAAGNTQDANVLELQKQMGDVEKRLKAETKLREAAEQKTAFVERSALAKTIAESQAQLHIIDAAAVPDKIKELLELKNGEQLQDLTLTAKVMSEQVAKIAGAAGNTTPAGMLTDFAIIGAGGEGSDKPKKQTNSGLMDGIA